MLPPQQPALQAPEERLRRGRAGALAAVVTIAALGAPAIAQARIASQCMVASASLQPQPGDPPQKPIDAAIEAATEPQEQPEPELPDVTPLGEGGPIGFEANAVEYDTNAELVTARGNVILRRGLQSVRADSVTWNRETGRIFAEGNLRLVDENGNQVFADSVELTDELKTGALQNLLLALREGGRLAAASGQRLEDGTVVLTTAAYTGCDVVDEDGEDKRPSWRIVADRVVYDPEANRVRFSGAALEVFGARVLPLPGLALNTDGGAASGLLIPDFRLSASNGIEVSEGWYQRLGPDKDLTITGHVFTEALPMISAQYRQLAGIGAYQITGYATRSSRVGITGPGARQTDFRGYLFANGRFQFSPEWSLTAATRVASDRTFLRRYDISRDDRLRSLIEAERIDPDSYLSIAGWATQTLRVGDPQGQVPIALPVIDYRRRLRDPVLGGRVELQANTLAIYRTAGQDTQRAFVKAQWDMRGLTNMGQELVLSALVRGDAYHSDENLLTPTAIYRGEEGWQTRGVATLAADVKWPLVGTLLGGTQVLTPRFQVVASPRIRNLAVPNEDARSIDLEDSNLFALNRFGGYDRIEDGVRFTYGLDWQLDRPGWRVVSTVGQSYRLTERPTLLPDGTGLSSRLSDVVGRTEVRFRDFVKVTHRFRLDKDSFAIRRNELDLTVGSKSTYAEVGYLKLDRNIGIALEDLKDREELRLAGRVSFLNYWSVFGSGIFNLTNRDEDPSNTSDGFEPLRTRLGVAYQDECLEMAFTWRRDFVATGDARRGNTFQVRVAFRNLGFR